MAGRLLGVRAMQAKLRQLADKFPDHVAEAIYQEARIKMTEAKRRTPVDTGTLRESGSVSQPERKGRNISVTLSFGGAAKSYAVFVHEDLDAYHKHGQAKFLESVLNESRSHMARRIAARVHLNRLKV